MVNIKQDHALSADGTVDLTSWLAHIVERMPEANLERIRDVCELSERAERKANATDGATSSSFRMGLEIADILSGLGINDDGLIAGIIYRAVRENQITLNHVRKHFGDEVGDLVEGVLRMAAISNVKFGDRKRVLGQRKDQMEQARRMLVAQVDDARIALIKLAERTCRIRAVSTAEPDKRISLAREIFEIYAPLAHRLGIGHLKWELEDLAFRYLEPLSYRRIAALLDEKRTARQEYIDQVVGELDRHLRMVGVEGKLEGRAKHIYSIWRKMRSKRIAFSEVHDVRAIRLLVRDADDCYRALGVVHNLWRNIPHEFDDYIATPKENGYRSLHTAVVGPEGKVLEVQIRTQEMHDEAEFGVCSHWQYKAPGDEGKSEVYEDRVEWLRQILEWQDESNDDGGLDRVIPDDVSMDRVYIYTPDGHVVDMSPGATPVDFAYRIHTEVGHKCRGAKVNERVVPLNTPLKSGDQVEIIVGEENQPRREWLYKHLGYSATSRARTKIQAWFGQREKQKNIDEGRKLLLNELGHLGIEDTDFAQLADKLGVASPKDLFCAIGAGDVQAADIIDQVAEATALSGQEHQLALEFTDSAREEVTVSGLGGMAYVISECCRPVPGDSIVGVIDDESTVHVHLQDCLEALHGNAYGRLIRLDWQAELTSTFPVSIEIIAYDRSGLLYDITSILRHANINVASINTLPRQRENVVTLDIVIEVTRLNLLLRTLEGIEQLPNVVSARRTIEV